jgi:Dyp-type peroxidase family
VSARTSERRLRLGRPSNLPRRTESAADFDLSDIQGNVLRGYTYPCAAYVFLHIDDPAQARALMARMLPQVATAEPWTDGPPATALHVAFTYAGLEALDLPRELLDSFPEEFREGMAARADRLGDRGPSAPEHWEAGLGTGEAHVLVTVYALDQEHLDRRRMELKQVGAAGAVTVVHEQRAEALPGGRDHFGFFDGIAQPAIQGSGVDARPGDGQPDGAGGWRGVCPGEFLLGHVDEDGSLPEAPAEPLHCNGTFMVYRKLRMDVPAFRRFVDEQGKDFPGGPERLGAKIVGRWPDGTPLSRSPDEPDPEIAGDPRRINDFGFADDREGLRCPLGAHIRRANPRDDANFFGGRLTNRHRLVRRGRAYGPPMPEGTEDDGAERGLVFVCFNASIWRQFETVQALWIDDGDPFGLGADKDFLIGEPNGDGTGKMTIQGHPPHILRPQPRFVTMRGGEYLFRPSMSGLRWLAGV